MSYGPAFDAKDRVRQAIDIVELVGGYLQLRREGRLYKAICPWHDDTRPSLQVNPDRQSFKCWVCDIGGDIFSFIMKMENVEFGEALKMLAERAGVDIRPATGERPAGPATDEKSLWLQAAAWVEQKYHDFLLKAPEAEAARRYLAERQITADSIRRFHLGYAPDQWEWLANQARGTPFSPRILNTIGILGQRQNSAGYYDRFKGRVLFSIRDTQGRPIALGGRILPGANPQQEAAKYVNSPETPLFSKSNTLYALDVAKDHIARRDCRTAIVMEGYTDALVAQQCGIQNAVACLGTAVGERHIKLLKRFADTIVLVLDGDEAGQKRTNEVLDLFVAEQADLRILTLPEEFDPCEFLLERGAEAFRTMLNTAVDALEHKLRTATRGIDLLRDTHRANQALEDVLATLAKAPRASSATSTGPQLREQQMLVRLAREFRLPEEQIRQRLTALRRAEERPSAIRAGEAPPTPRPKPTLDNWERELIEIVLMEPEAVARIEEELPLAHVTSPACREILSRCYQWAAQGITPSFDRLLLEFDEPEWKNLLVELDETAQAKGGTDLALRLNDVLKSFHNREQQRLLQATAKAAAVDESTLLQLIEQKRRQQGISAPTDG